MKKYNHFIFALILFLLSTVDSKAGNYTWDGSSSTAWADSSNWTTTNAPGVPSTNDTVTIETSANQPELGGDLTIKKFTMTSGTLDCNSNTLTITATATFNGGSINDGILTCYGTSTLTFAGTTFNVAVNATGNNILLNGSVFNSTLTAIKKGSSSDNGVGGNDFNGAVTLIDSGSGSLVLANNSAAPDTFNSTLTVSATSSGIVYLAHQASGNVFNGNVTFNTGNIASNTYGTASYNGNITLNSTSANISFGNSTGSWTLASGKNISIGTLSAGVLTIRNLTQTDGSINMRLVLTGTGQLTFGSGNSISANLYASAHRLRFTQSRFLGVDTLIFTGGNTTASEGGNYFGNTVYIANTASPTNYMFSTGSTYVDTFTTTTMITTTGAASIAVGKGLFLGAVTLKNAVTTTLTERMFIVDCIFKGAVTLDGVHSGIEFVSGVGNSLLDSTATLSLISGYAGHLTLSNIEQRGSNAINLDMSTNTSTGNNTILTIGPDASFNSDFTYLGQRLELNGGNFNDSASFIRFSHILDISEGGNTFNGTTFICDSVNATSANRVFKLANTTADDYNGNVKFKQYGTGSGASTMKMYPAYGANSTFAGNVSVESNNVPIEFGANGGMVILDGSGTQTLSKIGSYVPTFKNIEVNKSEDILSLGFPLTITDTLFLTKGVVATDATNLLIVADNGIVSGGSDTSYIQGPLKKIGNDSFIFPIGDTALHVGPFHPMTISAPGNSNDAFIATYFGHGTSITDVLASTTISPCQYWTLKNDNGSSSVKVNLGWNNWGMNGCIKHDTINMRIIQHNGSSWTSLGKDSMDINTGSEAICATTAASITVSTTHTLTLGVLQPSMSCGSDPPANYERGMYVDCFAAILFDTDPLGGDARYPDPGLETDLLTYIVDNCITYIALFDLDNGGFGTIYYPGGILGNDYAEDLLSDFIVRAKTLQPTLEVGAVISSEAFVGQTLTYDNIGITDPWPCSIGNGSSSLSIQDLDDLIHPDSHASDEEKYKGEMIKAALRVGHFNNAAGTPGGTSRLILPPPHAGQIDWISVEFEYWTSIAGPDGSDNFENYMQLLKAIKYAQCLSGASVRVESYLKILANDGTCNWINYTNGDKTGQQQADELDQYLDRILLVDYWKTPATLFDWHCHNLYFLGNPSTNKTSVIWPLMSVEYPELPSPQAYCNGDPISCDSRFLGLYLSPANTSTTNGPCNFGVDVGGGGTLGGAEAAWVSSSGQTSCSQCGGTFDSGSSPTFTDAVDNNIYNGTMWFTYTIMAEQGFLRKGNPNPTSLPDNNTDLVIYPNPAFSQIHLVINSETIGENGSVLLFNEFGKEVYKSSIIAHDKELDIRLPNLSSGLYLLKVFNSEKEVGSKKFVVL